MARALDRSLLLLRLIFVVATALIFFLMGLTYKHLEKVSVSNSKVNQSFDFSMKLEEFQSAFASLDRDQRSFVLTSDPKYSEEISKSETKIMELLVSLAKGASGHEVQLENTKLLARLSEEKLQGARQMASFTENFPPREQLRPWINEENRRMAQISLLIDRMLMTEKQLLDERRDELLFSQRSTPIYLYIISLFSLGLLLFSFFKISGDVKEQKRINQDLELSIDTLGLTEVVGNYGTWTKDLASEKYYFSDHLYKLLGLENKQGEESLERFLSQVHPEDYDRVKEKFERMQTEERVPSFRYRVIGSGGQQRQFQSVGRIVRTLGDSQVLLVMTMDVSREIEDQLKLEGINYMLTERNKNLSVANETYLEAEKIGYFGTWQYFYEEKEFVFSDNFVRLLGLDPNNFSNQIRQFLPNVHPEDKEMLASFVQAIYKGEDRDTFVSRILPEKGGPVRYVATTGKKISNPYMGDYYLAITLDISDEYQVQQALQVKNQALLANNKELQAFNYAASHDLQEPLRKIETFLSRLRDKDYERLSDNGKEYMDRTSLAAGRMRQLIDDLLHFSRSTRSEESFEWTDLNLLFHNALEELAHLIEEKKAKVSSEHLPSLTVIPFQIQQMFVNLIGNSLKYSKQDVPPIIDLSCTLTDSDKEAVLRSEVKKKYYKLTFSDNGIGFENQFSEKIFTLFSRLHGRSEYQGTGIGLAICKKIVENHNGYIYASSEPGKGAIFTVLLPVDSDVTR